jgi:hypothetical protein
VKLNLLSHAWTPTRLAALSELGLVASCRLGLI